MNERRDLFKVEFKSGKHIIDQYRFTFQGGKY